MSLRVRLLGELGIERDKRRVSLAGLTPKARAVLAILALRHGRTVPSEELIEALWPERDPLKAAAGLWVLVSKVRTALGERDRIEATRPGYRLREDAVSVDVDEFERVAEEGRDALAEGRIAAGIAHLERGAALYRGDLVEADPYSQWFLGPRARLRERHLAALEDLADAYVAADRPRDATTVLAGLLERDPTRESAYRRLMEAHYHAGEQGESLRAYERCRRVLDEELGVDPLPETMTLHERILRRELRPAAPQPAVERPRDAFPFVGRVELRAALERAVAVREGRILLVVGEAGAGKTRLVEEIVRGRRDLSVLRTRCYELERDLPFRPLADTLERYLAETGDVESLRRGLGASLPWVANVVDALGAALLAPEPPPQLPAEEGRGRTVEALARAVLVLARGRHLVWWVDDVQWADASTLEVVHFVARRAAGSRVLLVLAARSEDLPPAHPIAGLVAQLERAARAERLEVTALALDDVLALARVTGAPEAVARRIHVRAAGNAFFVTELLRGLRAAAPSEPLPASVRDTILARVGSLPEGARRALEAAAVLGGRTVRATLADVAQTDEAATASALDLLTERRLLRVDDGGHVFAHDLVREITYEAIGHERRALYHGRAADHLERSRPSAWGEIAQHAERAGDGPRAFRYALAAAERAIAGFAMREALAHLERAERAWDAADRRARRRCLFARAAARHALGETDAAAGDVRAALDAARAERDGADEVASLLHLADLEGSRDYPAALDIARSALARARDLPDAEARFRALTTVALMLVNRGAVDESAGLVDEAETLAASMSDEARITVLDVRGLIATFVADMPAARDAATRMLELLGPDAPRHRVADYLTKLGWAELFDGEIARGIADISRAIAHLREVDARSALARALALLAMLQLHAGAADQALRAAGEAEAIAAAIGHREWRTQARLGHALALAVRGDAEQASREIAALQDDLAALGSHVWLTTARFCRALAREAAGDVEGATTELREVVDAPGEFLLMRAWARAELARSLLQAGDREAAAQEAARAAAESRSMGLTRPYAEGILARARGEAGAARDAAERLRRGGAGLLAGRLQALEVAVRSA